MNENVDSSTYFRWFEVVGLLGGMMQFKVGFPRNIFRYIALLLFAKYIFITVRLLNDSSNEVINASPDYKGVFKYASLACRLVEFVYIIQKYLWYQCKNTEMESLLLMIKMSNTSLKIKCTASIQYIVPFLGFFCVLCMEHFVFVDYDSKFEYTISWGYANVIIILEYCFIQEINQNMKAKFFTQRQRLKLINGTTIQEDEKWNKLNILIKLNNVEMENKILEIRKSSRYHYGLVETTRKISDMFSLNILFTNFVIICNIINGLYNIVTHLGSLNYSMPSVCRSSVWIIFQAYISLIINDSWYSLAYECNKSPQIIHEIWNKCVAKKYNNRKLNYFQFIALRFHSTKLKFTADGFFNLDRTFFHSVAACVTTYVIILVQLKYQ